MGLIFILICLSFLSLYHSFSISLPRLRFPKLYTQQKNETEKAKFPVFNPLQEVLSGFVVSLSTIPPSVAYASVIGLNPLSGIWSTFVVGLFVALARGPGVIAGAAGVVAIPIARMVQQYGVQYMSAAVLLASIFELTFGALQLGRLAVFISEPVVAGFLNAFSIYLTKAQIKVFMINGLWLPSPELIPTALIALISFIIIRTLPYMTKTIPSSLVGLVASTLLAKYFDLPVRTLAQVSAAGAFTGGWGSLPTFTGLPSVPFNLETLGIVFPTAVAVTIISIVETIFARRVACTTITAIHSEQVSIYILTHTLLHTTIIQLCHIVYLCITHTYNLTLT